MNLETKLKISSTHETNSIFVIKIREFWKKKNNLDLSNPRGGEFLLHSKVKLKTEDEG